MSVHPSVTCALWQNQTMHYGCFDTTEKGNHSSFLTSTVVGWRRLLLCEISTESDPSPSKNAGFDRFPLITLIIKDSKKVLLWRIGNWPRAFRRAIDGVRTLPLSPTKGGPKSALLCFFNLHWMRSATATKFLCVKTCSGKVVYIHSEWSPRLKIHRYWC